MKINAIITGIGAYVPEYILTNDEISTMVDTSDEWIMSRIGIKERRILKEEGLGTSDMGEKAVTQLLEKTKTNPDEIELLICTTVTPDMQFPATANIICDKVGIKNAFSFDLNAGCSGFLFGLATGDKYIKSGIYKKVVIVGTDKMSSIVNYDDRSVSPIFGDGAGAAVLGPAEGDRGIVSTYIKSDGRLGNLLSMPGGGSANPATHDTVDKRMHFIKMEGREVFKHAVRTMRDAATHALNLAGKTGEDIDLLIPHQANVRIIDAIASRLKLPEEKVYVNIQEFGNTSAASIPIALDEARRNGKLKKDDLCLIVAFGGGFTWGSALIRM